MRNQLLMLTLLTGLSQVTAFLKLWFVARQFGIGSELDGYNLALVVPTFIAGITSALIQTGFFPVRFSYQQQATQQSLTQFERSILWLSIIFGALSSIVISFASPIISRYLVASESVGVLSVVESILPYLAILIVLNVATDVIGCLLAMHNKFIYAAAAPIVNGVLGALMLFLFPSWGLESLIIGTILGVLAQLIICFVGLKSIGFVFFGPIQSGIDLLPLVRKMSVLAAWILPGVIVSNFTSSMPMVWASEFGDGAVSTFGYAYRFHTTAVQVLVMASSTVILVHFSSLISKGDEVGLRKFLINSAFISFLLGIFSVVVVWFFGTTLLTYVFSGKFDVFAAEKVSAMWSWLTLGLGFSLLGNIFAKLWQAQGRSKLMSLMATVGLIVLCIIFFLGKDLISENVIGLALSFSSASIVFVGLFFLKNSK